MSRWIMLACGFLAWNLGCTRGPARDAVSLLGEREIDRKVDGLKRKLGVPWLIGAPAFYGSSCDVWYHGRGEALAQRSGVGLTFEHGRLTEVWYDQIDRTACEGDMSYSGKLPLGIYRGETRAGLIRRLGRPVARYHEMRSTWCRGQKTGTREFSMIKYHDGPRAVIVMTRDADRAPVTRVIVTSRDPRLTGPDPALGLTPAEPAVAARCLVEHRRQRAKDALAGGCRKSALYRGCHHGAGRCLSFSVRTPEKWDTTEVARQVGLKLARLSPTGAGEAGGGVTTVVLAACDDLPVGDDRDPCEAKDPLADCALVPEFRLE
jgi:hypothetical protein